MNDLPGEESICWVAEALIRRASSGSLQQALVEEIDRGATMFRIHPSGKKWTEMVPYDAEKASERYGRVALDAQGYEVGAAGFWHRRYDEQHRTVHALEDELRAERARYRQLQELTGGALVRSHLLRGNRELDAEKLAEQLAEAQDEIERLRGTILRRDAE